jgi:LysM repeat protein
MTTYTVKSGDTLSSIAKKFGINVPALMTVNAITDPNKIKVGKSLLIPEATTDLAALPVPAPPAPNVTTAAGLVIDRKKFALPPSQYFANEFPKDLIVLHFTAGQSAASAHSAWINSPLEVATAYIVDTDGKVYECFDPKHWAYHLGIAGAASANHKHDKRSIGIEIANVGPLKEDPADPNRLNWWPNNFGTKWCTKADTGKYVKASYRGFDYFASYPAVQSSSVAALVDHLCAHFGIPKTLPPASKRTVCDLTHFAKFSGIAAHQNFRPDKSDVGPAFGWNNL